MKTFKLLITNLVVFCFLFTTNVNAQEKENKGNSEKYVMHIEWPSPCAGETLIGDVVIHEVDNKNSSHFSEKGFLVGDTSGDIYNLVYVEKWSDAAGNYTKNFKLIKHGKIIANWIITYANGQYRVIKTDCYN